MYDYRSHPLDLDASSDELDLFAEEVPESQRHDLPPNSFSTLGCECELSTFFCYGCGADLVAQEAETLAAAGDLESALKWTSEKLAASREEDPMADVMQSVFRSIRRKGD